MITTAVHRGLIYAGQTRLASTIRLEQTGPMQVTVRAGTFTGTDGTPHRLAADQLGLFSSDPTAVKQYEAELGLTATGAVEVCLRSRIPPDGYPPLPAGWRTLSVLICTVTVPRGATDLTEVPIHVLTVRPGFPPGTGPVDAMIQRGQT